MKKQKPIQRTAEKDLKNIRKFLGNSIKDFSESIGISQKELIAIEEGKRKLTKSELSRICSVIMNTVVILVGDNMNDKIANFDDAPNYSIEKEDIEDYALKSAEVLFSKGIMRKIDEDTKYDEVIKLAIYACNKDGLPNNINPKVGAFCKILRDAHKIDSFRMSLNYPIIDTLIEKFPSNLVYDKFKKFGVIDKKMSENNADDVLVLLSSVFGLNYRYSYAILKRNDYVDKIIATLSFKDKNVNAFFNQIAKVLNTYIDRKIGE